VELDTALTDLAAAKSDMTRAVGEADGLRAALVVLEREYEHEVPALRGEAVQVDPIKTTLKAPGTKRLKLEFNELLSSFASKSNLRRYTEGIYCSTRRISSTSSCGWQTSSRRWSRSGATGWRQGLTLVHFSAQLEPFLPQNTS